jgi:hypothetical protein
MQFAAPTHEHADVLPCECTKCAYVMSVLASRATGRPAARHREDAVIS